MRNKASFFESGFVQKILSLVIASASVAAIFFIQANIATPVNTEASSDFTIATGYYLGKGTTRTISGLGFRPELLIIKSDTAAGQLVWKSSAMPEEVSTYLGVATADNTESQIIFTDDGFILSSALEVNTVNVNYTFVAFAGSDCTVSGNMCVGVYTGDANSTQEIDTGFEPDLVWVKRTTALAGTFRTSAMADNYGALFSATANNTNGTYFTTMNSDGFTVGATNNSVGGVYYYVAFKETDGKFKVGTYTGNAVDNRNITGLGFEPDFVLVKPDSAVVPAFNTTEMYGDYSSFTTAAASAVNHIQELISDGFQVGTGTSANANGVPYNYFAFGGAPDPNPSGSFLMERGSYVGNGTSQEIETSFEPNLVFIKGNIAQYAVWSTSLQGDATDYFALAGNSFTGGITGMDEDGFTVGNHVTVNTQDADYEYVAFGNATTPRKGDGAADFYIGSYTGNGIDNRPIDHLNFAPDMVVVKKGTGSGSASSVWQSSDMADNTTALFSATNDVTNGTYIKTLDDGGFTIGSANFVNLAGATYNWFAFKEGAGFELGTYTGDGAADRSITGLSFEPDLVWTKRNNTSAAVWTTSSSGLDSGYSLHFMNLAHDINDITSLLVNGFVIGNSAEVNTAASVYRYAAWSKTTSAEPPTKPVNSSPSDESTGQDLNVTISAPYVDDGSDPQLAAQWQVDDDSDFASPVWTRNSGSAETSIAVNSTNGTFANELAGNTFLDRATTYYWRVRYSDGVYSEWSTATSFETNRIVTPTNTSPADGGSVTSLTPVLTASVFSDPTAGHSSQSAQWQISSDNNFSSIVYDSGAVSYSASHAVPAAILSDRNSYHFRVRYQDSEDYWSEYSTPTRFNVAESVVSVTPAFGNISVDQGDVVKIDAQVKLQNGVVINDATVTIDIFNPSGTKIVTEQSMSYLSGSSGIYRYSYTVPATSGSYLYTVNATSDGQTGYGAANFQVGVTDTNITDIQDRVTSLQTNVDLLLGAFIAANSSINDSDPTASSFVTNLSNEVDDFYKNSVLTFTSGALNNQTRRISAYDGTTKEITLSPALTSAPGDGDTFTIVKQNVYVEEQAENLQLDINILKTDVAYIKSKSDQIYTLLQTVNSDLNDAQTSINQIRSTQQTFYRADITDVSEIAIGETYKIRLRLTDYESTPTDPETTPTIKIYNSLGEELVDDDMVNTSVSNYEYSYEIESDAVAGLWYAEVSTSVGDLPNQTLTDYFYVKGSPAQVAINSITDNTVPTIKASVIIENEGNADYEYQYEWCVVSSQDNPCGGGDDVYSGSAAKFIIAGEVFVTELNATVSEVGDYWFKVLVHYGSETSGASSSFTAVAEGDDGAGPQPSSSGSSSGSQRTTLDSLKNEILDLKQSVVKTSEQLAVALDVLGLKRVNGRSLVELNAEQLTDFKTIQNKLSELTAVSSSIRQVVDQGSAGPIVETFMGFNSVEISFLITNPASTEQTLKFKSFLPKEVKPEHIMGLDGLSLDFDPATDTYFVSGDIKLGAKEATTRKIEIKDIWVFPESDLKQIKEHAEDLASKLSDTHYAGQGSLIKNEITSSVDLLLLRQKESYSSPQDHIVVYRENQILFEKINGDLEEMKDLVVRSGAEKGLFGRLGGIEVFSMWGIILVVLAAFTMLSLTTFRMWKNQTLLMQTFLSGKHGLGNHGSSSGTEYQSTNISYQESDRGLAQILLTLKALINKNRRVIVKVTLWTLAICLGVATLVFSIKHFPRLYKTIGGLNAVVSEVVQNSEVYVAQTEQITQKGDTGDLLDRSSVEGQKTKLEIIDTPTGWLNVRSDASIDSQILAKVNVGEVLEYTEIKGDWYKVVLENLSGWVNKEYVKEISND